MNSQELAALLESIRDRYGYDFTGYSETSLKRRIKAFMARHNIPALDFLTNQLLKDEKLFEQFIQELPVTVTDMFRDPEFYKSLTDKVFTRLATYPFINIWIAGCATGEEIYSMAILLEQAGLLERSRIYATDINRKSLKVAEEGRYSVENVPGYVTNYEKCGTKKPLSDYYEIRHDVISFNSSLKRNLVFIAHNLVTDKSFNEFQLVICRNVLIYFTPRLQNEVLNLFYESLCPFGFLGLGSKESLLFAEKRKLFEVVDGKEKLYRKIQ